MQLMGEPRGTLASKRLQCRLRLVYMPVIVNQTNLCLNRGCLGKQFGEGDREQEGEDEHSIIYGGGLGRVSLSGFLGGMESQVSDMEGACSVMSSFSTYLCDRTEIQRGPSSVPQSLGSPFPLVCPPH